MHLAAKAGLFVLTAVVVASVLLAVTYLGTTLS
jgi:hypothetical protein